MASSSFIFGINLLHWFRESAKMPPFYPNFTNFRAKQQKLCRRIHCIGGYWQLVNITLCLQASAANLRTGRCLATQNSPNSCSALTSSSVLHFWQFLFTRHCGPRGHCTNIDSHAQNKRVVFWRSLPTGFVWLASVHAGIGRLYQKQP